VDAVRPWLYVGKLVETLDGAALRARGIGAMLQLCEEVPQEGIVHRYLDIDDGEPIPPALFDEGVTFLREQRAAGRVVLVACGRGASRSATFATAALKEEEGLPLLDAFRMVAAGRREARPHPALWRSLCDRYSEDIPLIEMLRACRPPGWT
jgi:hypothetical protein